MTRGRRSLKHRKVADALIRWGLGFQIVFLAFLDWGTMAWMQRSGDMSSIHVIGLVVVNVLLIGATFAVWTWMRSCQNQERGALPTAVARQSES